MDPQYLFFVIAALACPIVMGGLMLLMMRQGQQMSMGGQKTMPHEHSIAALQAQRDTLDKEIRALEAVQALQTQRDQLQRQIAEASEQAQV